MAKKSAGKMFQADRKDIAKFEALQEEAVKLRHQLEAHKNATEHFATNKLGLHWDIKEPESVVVECQTKLPVLEEVEKYRIENGNESTPTHLIIEGDNYHALAVLNYTHSNKIDAIYIDPPYNTGAKDWRYNNNYVDINDGYRHSKWLSMMDSRLRLSKKLLKDSGIICVTIDDYEMARLMVLMEQIFGENNHLGTIVIRNNPSGRSTEKGFSIAHEYALFFAKSPAVQIGRLERTESQIARYDESDSNGAFEWVNFRKHGATREESPSMFYPIFLTENGIRIPKIDWDIKKEEWRLLEQPKKNEKISYPIDEDGHHRRWKWGIERAKAGITEMKVNRDRNGDLAVYIKSRLNDSGMLPLTWWDKKEYSATAYGTNLLKTLFGKLQVFSYPKSLFAVIDCLKIMSGNKDAVILDFFAGSGTTGHAVMQMNKNDNGKRQFILVTNNENSIAEDVTFPRIKRVIAGVNELEEISGYKEGVRYFKTAFVPKGKTNDQTRLELVEKASDMIRVRESAYDCVVEQKSFKLYRNAMAFTAIFFEPGDIGKQWTVIEKKNPEKLPVRLYVFSFNDYAFVAEIPKTDIPFETCPIPESVLEVYRRVFKKVKK